MKFPLVQQTIMTVFTVHLCSNFFSQKYSLFLVQRPSDAHLNLISNLSFVEDNNPWWMITQHQPRLSTLKTTIPSKQKTTLPTAVTRITTVRPMFKAATHVNSSQVNHRQSLYIFMICLYIEVFQWSLKEGASIQKLNDIFFFPVLDIKTYAKFKKNLSQVVLATTLG